MSLVPVVDESRNKAFESLETQLYPPMSAPEPVEAEVEAAVEPKSEVKQRATRTRQFIGKIFDVITAPFRYIRDKIKAAIKTIMYVFIAIIVSGLLALILWLLFGKFRIQDKIKRSSMLKKAYKQGAARAMAEAM